MANSFYNHGTTPITLSQGSSALIRAELDAVTVGFDKFPTLAANSNKALVINGAGTAITVTTGTLALAGNFATTGTFNTTFAQQANVTLTLPATSGELMNVVYVQGQLWGLRLSNNAGDATNDIDISTGGAIDLNATTYLSLASALTKRLDATWVTGTNQGGRSSSLSISDTTWHVFLILVSGVVDVGFDTSVTGSNLVTDHGATKVRRIGSILREGGSIVSFNQIADYFFRSTPIQSVSTANPGTSAVTATLHTPLGIVTQAIVFAFITDTTPTVTKYLYLSSLDQTDTVPADNASTVATETTAVSAIGSDLIKTNTSSQIRYRLSTSDADISVKLNTHGWIDTRGQYD
jgi:hypothetical protein